MSTHLADLLLPFAEAASVSTRDAAGLLRRRTLVSLQFAEPERLHGALFPKQHFDWASVREYLGDATAMHATDWVRLIQLYHFINEPAQATRAEVAELLRGALAGIRVSTQGRELTPIESLKLCFARAGIQPSWDLLCKTLLLVNLADVEAGPALVALFGDGSCLLSSSGGSSPSAPALPALMTMSSSSSNNNNGVGSSGGSCGGGGGSGNATATTATTATANNNNNSIGPNNANNNNTPGGANGNGSNGSGSSSNNNNNNKAQQVADVILKHLFVCKHSQQEYTAVFTRLLSEDGCHVASHLIMQSIRAREEAQERVRQTSLSVIRSSAKPSLTRILEARQAALDSAAVSSNAGARGGSGRRGGNPHNNSGGSSGGGGGVRCNSFRGFCQVARLSANMNTRVKTTLYYIAALPALSIKTKGAHYRRLIGDDPSCALMLNALLTQMESVSTQPDAQALREFLAQTTHSGAPCAALQQFRIQCVPGGGVGTVTWTVVLRLYLAAFCRPPLHKELWDHVLSESNLLHLNHSLSTIETDAGVQAFVRAHTVALDDTLLDQLA